MAKLNITGRRYNVDVEPDTPLLWAIREHVGLTGTKYGCGVVQCGACSVHLNGNVVRSCSIPVSAIKDGDKITTIEGLSRDSSHPVQKAWAAIDVPQPDGSVLRLRKTHPEYDPLDRVKAQNYIAEHQAKGELVTGLLYIQPDAEDLHAHLDTVATPFNRLGTKDLCPGAAALEKLNAALR